VLLLQGTGKKIQATPAHCDFESSSFLIIYNIYILRSYVVAALVSSLSV
jgi:hypothetical protein